jgi:hypothetical protein
MPDICAKEQDHIHSTMWPRDSYAVCIPIVSFSLALPNGCSEQGD